ncbi:MAG: outer membrane protein assembly factor BamD [Acidobacteriales bacterium]|nr:outer membrane protein assembly factor BamD [Terriglobales bacterium]
MKPIRSIWLLAVVLALPCAAQKREIQDLQRDVALLQDDVKSMRKTLDESMTALKVLTQQILDTVNRINTGMAVMDNTVRDRLKDQEKSVIAPVAGVGTKIDQMTTEFSYVKETVTEMNTRMGKLERQVLDLGNSIKTLNAPPAPPDSSSTTTGGGAAGVSAEQLYESALRDKSAGHLEMALQQFAEYLRLFGTTQSAPNAQYQIGEIYYQNGDYAPALKAFDTLLEKYPENNKTRDGMYMKGMALTKLGRRTDATRLFQDLIDAYPNSEQATKAKAQLRSQGVTASKAKAKKKAR